MIVDCAHYLFEYCLSVVMAGLLLVFHDCQVSSQCLQLSLSTLCDESE